MTRHTPTKEPKPIDSIFDIRARLQDSFNRVNGMLKVMESNASTEKVRLQLSAELRHHIAMAEKTLAGAYRAEAVDYFIDCVMEAFQALGPTAQRTFIKTMSMRQSQLFERKLMHARKSVRIE